MSNNPQIKKDLRCATCMMHRGFEAGITAETFTAPRESGSMASTFRRNSRYASIISPIQQYQLEI